MTKLQNLLILFALLISPSTFALNCMDMTDHLRFDHGAYIVDEATKESPNFKYFSAPGCPYKIATKDKTSAPDGGWNAKFSNDCSHVEIANPAFGYGIEFKGKECTNTYMYDTGSDDNPKADRFKSSNVRSYDWQICEGYKPLAKSMKLAHQVNSPAMLKFLKKFGSIRFGDGSLTKPIAQTEPKKAMSKIGDWCSQQEEVIQNAVAEYQSHLRSKVGADKSTP